MKRERVYLAKNGLIFDTGCGCVLDSGNLEVV